MAGITLFKEGGHITDVSIQYGGEIAIGSGGVGGEFYLRIPPEECRKLLSALADAGGTSLSNKIPDGEVNETVLALFLLLFGNAAEDPYVDIQKFLRTNNVRYKGEYWPDR